MIKLFDMKIGQNDDILIEGTGKGDLLISVTGAGAFSGNSMNGRVLPLGITTSYTPSAGVNLIQAPFLLETDDKTMIFMRLEAYLHLAQELEDKLISGEAVSPDEYYYKGTVSFDAGAPQYKWLENKIFVCDGIIDDWKSLRFTVYEA